MTAHDQPDTERARDRDRAAFFRKYFAPFSGNTRRGFAIVDAGSCTLLFANTRFLASHGVPATARPPLLCAGVHGVGERPCLAQENTCRAQQAARTGAELRTSERRAAAAGLPERDTEIAAIPLFRSGERAAAGDEREVVVIEKDLSTDESASADPDHEYLAAISRYSADAIIGLGPDGRIRSWNRGAEQTFGYLADETIGRSMEFLVPDNDADRRAWQDLQKECERTDLVRNYQANRLTKDGRAVIVNCTSSRFRDTEGKPRGTSIICRDVTLEVLLRELIEHQLRAMSVIHEVGDVLHSTRSVEEILRLILLGVTAGQGLGFNRAFLLLVERAGDGAEHIRGKLAIGPSNPDEANRIWSTLAGAKLSLTELHDRYLVESGERDVLVNSIVRQIDVPLHDGAHVFSKAIRERRAIHVMRGAAQGVAAEEVRVDADLCSLLTCDTFAVVPLDTRERSIGLLVVDNRISGLPITDADVQMLKVFANHAGSAIENSRLRRNLEHRLEELERLNRSLQDNQARLMRAERLSVVGEMAARVAHEVRNPLVAIGGFARLVRKGMAAEDPRSDYLRIISDEVARLERIVQELLDFSRPQERVELSDVDLKKLVHEIVSMATVEAHEHGVEVRESFDDAIGTVRVDDDKLRQVLLNLLRNALDAMQGGGLLEVESVAEDGDMYRVTVRDNGPGIPVDKRDKIFAPGFTTRHKGTGFGLAIAKRLVELHGGRITLREDVPVGCTFDIVLPRTGANAGPHEGEASS